MNLYILKLNISLIEWIFWFSLVLDRTFLYTAVFCNPFIYFIFKFLNFHSHGFNIKHRVVEHNNVLHQAGMDPLWSIMAFFSLSPSAFQIKTGPEWLSNKWKLVHHSKSTLLGSITMSMINTCVVLVHLHNIAARGKTLHKLSDKLSPPLHDVIKDISQLR